MDDRYVMCRNELSRLPWVIYALVALLVFSVGGCREDAREQSADAGSVTKELTIYVGPPTPFRVAISAEAIEDFANNSGYHLEFIQLGSWFVRSDGDPPIDILDNLDLFINDDQKYYDSNPIRKRNKPDLILTSSWDTHIRTKAIDGYFSPVTELFRLSPDFRKAHSSAYWDTNLRGPLAYGVPLYSFQQDDVPGYWLIDAAYRRTLVEKPISNLSEFLAFAEIAVETTTESEPIISTSTIPLGAIALGMEYGYTPLYRLSPVEASGVVSAFGTDIVVSSPFRRSSRNNVTAPHRTVQLYRNLATFPLVYSPAEDKIVNLLGNPPIGFDEVIRQIGRITNSGYVAQNQSQTQGLSKFLLGACKAVFFPADFGLETLHNLISKFPDTFMDRFEIVPASAEVVASLEASFRAWIPESTAKMDTIAELFTSLANPELVELMRYGREPEHWKATEPFGIAPGDIELSTLFLPTGYYLELMTRAGIPERVPTIVAPSIQSYFRLDVMDSDSFVQFPSEKTVFDPVPITGALGAWDAIASRYTEMLEGTAEFVMSRSYLINEGQRALEEIERELNRQLE